MKLAPATPWGEIPVEVGGLRIAPVPLDAITEVLPIGGADVSAALEAAIGVGFPEPGCSAAGEVRIVWSGREAALVLGASVHVEGALCVDQSDGWAALEMSGAVREALARLCPLDLRETSFPPGATARTLLNHVGVSLTRTGPDRWLLLAPRSMAGTVLEEITVAAAMVAAR